MTVNQKLIFITFYRCANSSFCYENTRTTRFHWPL